MPISTDVVQPWYDQNVPLDYKPEPIISKPSSLEIWPAAFRTENSLSAGIETLNAPPVSHEKDANFDALTDDYLGDKYKPWAKKFVRVGNKAEGDAMKASIDRELADRQTLDQGGFEATMARMTAGIVDPISLIGMAITPELVAGKFVASAAKAIGVNAGFQAAQELALQSTTETRTWQESATNVAGAALISGILGGAAGKLTKPQFDDVVTRTAADLGGNKSLPTPTVNSQPGSVGAAAVRQTTKAQETLSSALGLEKLDFTPTLSLANSRSVEARRAGQELGMDALQRVKNTEGIATPHAAELEITRYHADSGEIRQAVNDHFLAFKNGPINAADLAAELERAGFHIDPADVVANPSKYLKVDYFKGLAAGAARNGDASAFPQVSAVAKTYRGIAQKYEKELTEAGMLPRKEIPPEPFVPNTELAAVAEGITQGQVAKTNLQTKISTEAKAAADRAVAMAQPHPDVATAQNAIEQISLALKSVEATNPRMTELINSLRGLGAEAKKPVVAELEKLSRTKAGREFKKQWNLLDNQRRELLAGIDEIATKVKASHEASLEQIRLKAEAEAIAAHPLNKDIADIESRIAAEAERLKLLQKENDIAQAAHANQPVKYASIDPITALSYVNRIWDKAKIKADAENFRATLVNWLEQTQKVDPAESRLVADDVINGLLGTDSIKTTDIMNMMPKAGPLHKRTLLIPDNLVAKYLSNDIEKITDSYVRGIAPELVLTRRFGDKELNNNISRITSDYDKLKQKAREDFARDGKPESALNKELAKLEKEKKSDIENVEFLRNKLLGTAGKATDLDIAAGRSTKVIRQLVMMAQLGGQTISSFADLGRPIMVHGLSRYGKAIHALASNPELRKASKEELQSFGVALEVIQGSRFQKIADIAEDFGDMNIVERGVDRMSQVFSKLTGMQIWNSQLRQVTGLMTGDRILAHSPNWATINKTDRTFLAKLGIDEGTANRIAAEFKLHGEEMSGMKVANLNEWTDIAAKDAYELSVLKASEFIINTPTAGAMPKFMSTWWGKTLMQFKSFLFAAHEQTLLAGLQVHDANTVIGALGMVMMGAVVTGVKTSLNGKEPPKNGADWLINAIDASGVAALPLEINNVSDKLSGGNLSIRGGLRNMGIETENKRFVDRSKMGSLAGASWGYGEKMVGVPGQVYDLATGKDEWNYKNTQPLFSVLPGQNLLGMRPYQMLFNHRETWDRINAAQDKMFGPE